MSVFRIFIMTALIVAWVQIGLAIGLIAQGEYLHTCHKKLRWSARMEFVLLAPGSLAAVITAGTLPREKRENLDCGADFLIPE